MKPITTICTSGESNGIAYAVESKIRCERLPDGMVQITAWIANLWLAGRPLYPDRTRTP